MRRIKDTALLVRLKLEYDECELSGETQDLHLHHVYFKSQGGDDLRSNIICLGGRLHELYHRGDEDAKRNLATYIAGCRPDTMLYLEEKLGSQEALGEWLERHGLERRSTDERSAEAL